MNCFFQLDRYQIESVSIAPNPDFDPALPAHTGEMTASINIAPNTKAPNRYRLTMEIQVKPSAEKEKEFFPYLIAIKGRAFFTFKAPCTPEQADHVLRLNGAAILHGLLRAQVAQITAQSVHGQFLLPAANFQEMENRPKGCRSTTDTPPTPEATAQNKPPRIRRRNG